MDTATVRRSMVGRSVLGWVALACLVLNGTFWLTLMLDLLRPPTLLSPQTIQAGLAIAAFALILPLFWSMLLPSSPAGRLLQRQTWKMPGQLAVTFAAVFLTWMAATWLRLWWAAQPGVVEAGQDLFLTITSLIAGVLVPALSWCVMTPEQWVAQIEQARHVRRLEHAMQMEETAMRAAYARAVSLLNADLTYLTIGQRRELAGILGGFARVQQQALASIAQSWGDMYGVEAQIASVPDQELLDCYQEVADLLASGADAMSSSVAYASQVRACDEPDDRAFAVALGSQTNAAANANEAAHSRIRTHSYECANAVANAADMIMVARRELGTTSWKRERLMAVTGVKATKASALIKEWHDQGLIIDITNEPNAYQFAGVQA